MKDNKLTARRLQKALSDASMRAQELSDKSGVAKSSISQYLNASHAPSNLSAGKMGKVLGVNPLWLMGFDVPEHETESENYYINGAAREYADFLHKNPNYKVLFDATKKVKPEDIDFVRKMIDRMTDSNDDTGC